MQTGSTPDPGKQPKKQWRLAVGALVAVLLCAATFLFPIEEWIGEIQEFVGQFGHWGPLLFVGIYATWTLTTMPSIPMAILSGVLFGPWFGALYSLAGASCGSSMTFFLGRQFGQDFFLRLAEKYPVIERLERLAAQRDFIVVAILRIAPVFPVTLLNYGLGLTRMRFRSYFIFSLLLTIPGAAFYAGVGTAISEAFETGHLSSAMIWSLGAFGLLILSAGFFLKRRLAAARDELV
ncbi:TVP38/TMEM64 family protein [bacterium]|nr:TVP38/TMEM64 family protein [bacterium]